MLFSMSKREDILKAIEKIKKQKEIEEFVRSEAIKKIVELNEQIASDSESFFAVEDRVDEMMGNYSKLSKCNTKIAEYDELLKKLNEKLNNMPKR